MTIAREVPMIRGALMLLSCLVVAACNIEIYGPGARIGPDGLPTGLAVQFEVDPGEVEQSAEFTARLRVTNVTADTVRVVTGDSCLATLNVLRHGKRVPFRWSDRACLMMVTTHTFAPGATTIINWPLRAELYAEQDGDAEGAPAPKGRYIVRAEFHTATPGERPVVEAVLRVR